MFTPPIRIETPRLLIRPYDTRDAAALQAAITANLSHLRPWMPWALHEPETVRQKQERIRGWQSAFAQNLDYTYGIFDEQTGRLLGSTGLHRRQGPGVLEIGYWLRQEETGKGYASESTYALTKAGLQHLGAEKMEIRCDAANAASANVPARLGYAHEYTFRLLTRDAAGSRRQQMVWVLFPEEFSPRREYEPVGIR